MDSENERDEIPISGLDENDPFLDEAEQDEILEEDSGDLQEDGFI